MLPVIVLSIERIHNRFDVFLVTQEIGLGSVDKTGFDIVLFDLLDVSFLERKEVFPGNGLFKRTIPPFYPFL